MAAHILTALRQERDRVNRSKIEDLEFDWGMLDHMLDYSIPANALDSSDYQLLKEIIRDHAFNTLQYVIRNLIDKYYDLWGRLGQPPNHEAWQSAYVAKHGEWKQIPVYPA